MKRICLSVLAFAVSFYAAAQGEIPVSMYTGSPGISIYLYTLNDHDLSESIALSYDVEDLNVGGTHAYGVGWDISAGHQEIARQVRGLPDDFLGGSGDTRRGWLYNANYSGILSFGNSSDLSTSTYTDETSDNTYINNLNYKVDTEPDLFSFSVAGFSGHFVFDNTGNISLIPHQDILIVPTYASSPTDLTITGWTITTNAGVVYTFNQTCTVSRKVIKASNYSPGGVDQTMLNLMERDYQLFSSTTTYTSSWMLRTVSSPSGAAITYSYTSHANTNVDPKNVEIFDASWTIGGTVKTVPFFALMKDSVAETRQSLSQISTSTGLVATMDSIHGVKLYDSARAKPNFKNFVFSITSGMLRSVTETDTSCYQLPPYLLYYNGDYAPIGLDFWGFNNGNYNFDSYGTSTMFPTVYVYPTESGKDRYRLYRIPSYFGTEVILTGDADRNPTSSAAVGALSRLVYPQGGESDFTFENNTYYDSKAGKDQFAGGLRIKSITYFDGVNPGANISKQFTYADSLGRSSGHLISPPQFAIPVWQYKTPTTRTPTLLTGYTVAYNSSTPAATLYRQMTAVTSFDIGPGDDTNGSTVGYSRVTVSRSGSGKVVFDYYVPAAYRDGATGSGATDWIPTTMKFARPNTNPGMHIISTGETYGFPSFPQSYYDYERGLLKKKSEYNESGTLVRLTQDTYQYLYRSGASSPTSIVGLAYEKFANTSSDNIFLYGRYSLLGGVTKVVSSETMTTYDENATSRNLTETAQYLYDSTSHIPLRKIKTTAADGTVYSTTFKYARDYPYTGTPTDTTLLMIKWLNTANRKSTVIEQSSTMKPPVGSEVTTGSSLLKYAPFSFAKPLMKNQLIFRPSTPVTDFVASGVTSNAFTNDSRYEVVQTVSDYTTYDIPVGATGENRNISGALFGYKKRVPVAQISQATAVNVAFSDFEMTNGSEFSVTSGYYGAGRTGQYGIHPYATLVRTLTKPAGANYMLSFWLKGTSGTGVTLQVVIKNGSGTTISTTNYTFTPSGSDYQYFTQAISLSGVTTSTFSIQIHGQSFSTPSGTASTLPIGSAGSYSASLLPMLDDIEFYPDYATVSARTYDLPFGANSVTDASGKTAYTTYDALGRTKFIIDQDHNIRKRFTYSLPGQVNPSLIASVTGSSGPPYQSIPVTFTANPNSCLTGTTYEWNFGSGYSSSSSSNVSPAHTYSSTGTYSVKLRVSNPDYTTDSTTYSTTVTLAPLAATICATGVKTLSNGTVTESYSCFTNTSPPDRVTFEVNSVSNQYSYTLSYQWKSRSVGTSTWTNVGTNSATYGPTRVFTSTPSFEVICTVSSSDGRTTDSEIMTVNVNNI